MIAIIERPSTPMLGPIVQIPDDWFDGFGIPSMWRGFGPDAFKVEEFRDDDTLVIRAEIPGVDPDKDIDVTVDEGSLRITVERTQRRANTDTDQYRSEFRYGSFTRVLDLPFGARIGDPKASYRHGILEVRLAVDAGQTTA
jgi:HSP20 family protein